jgi:hypothetical protein
MGLKDEFRKMIMELTRKFKPPPISDIFFPPFYQGGQPKDAHFMAVSLEGGATGISCVLLPDEKMEEYNALHPFLFIGKNPQESAIEFGSDEPVREMISLAAINAICQHVMRATDFPVDHATDSLGLVTVSPGDKIGMVGLFYSIVKRKLQRLHRQDAVQSQRKMQKVQRLLLTVPRALRAEPKSPPKMQMKLPIVQKKWLKSVNGFMNVLFRSNED